MSKNYAPVRPSLTNNRAPWIDRSIFTEEKEIIQNICVFF